MRFHILGTQGIGFLIAHILKRNNHDVTLLLRDRLSLANFTRKDRVITVHYQNDAVETSNGYQLEVLRGPGMGVNETGDVESNELAYPLADSEYGLGENNVKNADPDTKGHYYFPSNSCYTRGQFEVMVERLGRVYFGIVPGEDGREVRVSGMANERLDGFNSEKAKINSENNNIDSAKDNKKDSINSFSTTQSSLHSTISILTSLPLLSFTRLFYPVVIDHLLEKLLINACLAPISTLFNVKYGSLLYNMPANRVLKKVVSEASAVVRAYRGFVIGGFLEAERKAREANMEETSDTDKEFSGEASDAVAHEKSSQVVSCDESLKLDASPSSSPKPQFTTSTTHSSQPSHSSVSPSLPLPLTNRFGPDRILDAVLQICNTHPHISSPMSSAVLSCRLTDIDYVNGFIVKSGRMCGLSTPVNEFLIDAIKMKHRITCRNRETGRKTRNGFKG
ncbi:2408_t:CDS:2 [Paraglomus brasilianum]|uniref:2408_t:CDS:1 n=1 Tax=Paraglomus brasilianum TaxID=144538 RepID=A0A9N8ZD94_9GLOM|nr:2408_t:CDS:2 [Paraglomus brasilianum]